MGTRTLKAPAVFLDRDGTIIFDRNYLKLPKQVRLYSFAAESINRLKAAGFKVVVVTNQSGVARGFFSENELKKVHDFFFSLLMKAGTRVDALYYCPHVDEDNCNCRKPKIGMALKGEKDLDIDLKRSYAVGNSIRDYILGFNMGGKGILVLTGHGKKQRKIAQKEKIKPLAICKSLRQAVDLITMNRNV
jgi:histidinol-phosphate phosphatase family protein